LRIQFLELPEEVQRMLEEDFERRLEREVQKARAIKTLDADATDDDKNCTPGYNFVGQPNFQSKHLPPAYQPDSQPSDVKGLLTPSHAEVLLRIKDKPEAVKEIAQAIRENNLTREETSLVVNQVYRGIDPKQALKNAIEQMNKEFDEINEKYGHIFDGLIPSRRGIVHRLVELFTTEDFTDEEKKKIVELVNVKSLDDAVWEVKKMREKHTDAVDFDMEIAYLRKENDMLREKIAQLEEQSRLREDLVVRCPFCGRDFQIREHVVA
jgi:hypothetical protein